MAEPATPASFSDWHAAALEFAVACNQSSKVKYNSAPDHIVRGAIFVLSHDAVITHRAIGLLVDRGWSSSGASLVRTLFDISVSVLAILNSADPKLAAFKYFYSNYRETARDESYEPEFRREMRDVIRSRIKSLAKRDRSPALEFLKLKDRPYWFADEWHSPSEVIRKFGLPGMDWTYKQFSAAAHGGFFGLRLFRDRSDDFDINPRLPVGTHGDLVLAASTRLLLELCRVRITSENLPLARQCYDLTRAFNAFGRNSPEADV